MAVPTISTVLPVSGPAAGGNLIVVTGTNFRVPTVTYANPMVAVFPSVRVLIGGRTARRVDVLSTTSLRVLVPRYWHQAASIDIDAYSPVSVVVTNLNSGGNPIAGETVTLPAAYTYSRWNLGPPRRDTALLRIAKELIYALKLEVDRYTHMTTHVDYGDSGTAVIIQEAKLPSVNLVVSTPKDIEYSAYDNTPEEIEQPDGSFKRYEGARTHMLEVNLYLAAEGSREAMNLTAAVEEFVQVNPGLQVTADPDLYPGEEDSYPVEISRDAVHVSSPGSSSIVTYSMQLRVRGISVLPGEPTEIAEPINQFILAVADLGITAPREMTF